MRYYGNLAYDDDYRSYTSHSAGTETHNKTADTVKRNHSKMKDSKKGLKPKRSRNALILAEIIALALAAGFMISEFVAVHESRSEVSALETKLANAEAATSQKAFELEQSVDLTEIEKEATTRLGMQRPEKYQTIYINVPMEDVTDTTAGAVEGVGNSIKNFFGEFVSNIVEFFSIK